MSKQLNIDSIQQEECPYKKINEEIADTKFLDELIQIKTELEEILEYVGEKIDSTCEACNGAGAVEAFGQNHICKSCNEGRKVA